MNSIRIALTELRRLTAGRLPRLAVLAMVLVPTLYGGLYLYANHDPYAALSRVPAAIVVQDRPVTVDGDRLQAGRDVADQVKDSGDFDWHEVSAAEADEGVGDGTYDFALTIPRDFSASLSSSARFEPEQAQLTMTTNDANSYLSTTIADQVTGTVRDAIATKVSERAATDFLLGIDETRQSLVRAEKGADRLVSGLKEASDGADRLVDGAGRLEQGASDLSDGATTLSGGASDLDAGLGDLEQRTAGLPDQTRRLATGARKVADGNDEIAGIGGELADAAGQIRSDYTQGRSDLRQRMQEQGLTAAQRQEVLAVYDRLGDPIRRADQRIQGASGDLDRLAGGADDVASGAERLADATPALTSGIADAHDGAGRLATGASDLADGATTLDQGAGRLESATSDLVSGLGRLQQGAQRLATGLGDGIEKLPDVDEETRESVAKTIGDPVQVEDRSQASAGTYGAGLAPFFLSLAAWIGGYVLFLLVKPLSRRALAANQASVRVALGGWLTPAAIGVVQMLVMLSVVFLAIDIEPRNLPGTLVFLLLVSATFVAIVHMLNAWLGAAGQFLGLVLMVVQLVTAGGTFPWQTIPVPLHPLHQVLPMSYAVDGLRQLMYGGLDSLVWRDVLVLGAWGLFALALTTLAARRQRRWSISRIQPELTL